MAKGSQKKDSKKSKPDTPKYQKKRGALTPPEFHYEGHSGPEHWSKIVAFPLCNRGTEQSPIVVPTQGNLPANLPLEIQVTRPQERYSMRLTYQAPEAVTIGTAFPDASFPSQFEVSVAVWSLGVFGTSVAEISEVSTRTVAPAVLVSVTVTDTTDVALPETVNGIVSVKRLPNAFEAEF